MLYAETLTLARIYDLPDDSSVQDTISRGFGYLRRAGVSTSEIPSDWQVACAAIAALIKAGRFKGDDEDLRILAEDAEALADHDPSAALLPAAFAVAAWEIPAAGWLFSTSNGAKNWGWHDLVLPLARIMARIPAIWSGRHLIEEALRSLRYAGIANLSPQTAETLTGFRALRDELERRYIELRDSFAMAVKKASAVENAAIRAPLAALWWSLGDPWHAHGISETGFQPTFSQVQQLIDRVLRSVHTDPMLAATAERLWRAVPISSERYQSIYRRMKRSVQLHESYVNLEEIIYETGVSPSAAYSRALTSYFAGTLSSAEKDTISTLAPYVDLLGGIAAIRFTALNLLLGSIDGPQAQRWWHDLARQAAAIVQVENYRAPYLYDRSLDLPLYYLEDDNERLFLALERHRRASMEFVIRNIRPFTELTPQNGTLLNEEGEILSDIRWLRHQEIPAGMKGHEVDPRDALTERLRRLDEIVAELRPVALDYVKSSAFNVSAVADLQLGFDTGFPKFPDQVDGVALVEEAPESALRLEGAHALLERGSELVKMWAPDTALRLYCKIAAAFSEDTEPALREVAAEALTRIGMVLDRLDRHDEEIKSYEKVVMRFGDDLHLGTRIWVARALYNKALTLGHQGDLEAELQVYDEILGRFAHESDPGLCEPVAKAMFNMGRTLSKLDRAEAAICAYDHVMLSFGKDPDPNQRLEAAKALNNKAVKFGQLDRASEQIAAYDQVVACFGDESDLMLRREVARALFYKGLALNEQGQSRDATDAYRQVEAHFAGSTDPTLLEFVRLASANRAEI